MATTDISICSAALTRIGAQPMSGFDDGDTAAAVAAANYPIVAENALSEYRWRFATKNFTLNLLDETPDLPWTQAWEWPADALLIHTVIDSQGNQVSYEIQGTQILTTSASDPEVIYAYAVEESAWPPYFVELITCRMAAIFAAGVAEKADLAKLWEERAEIQYRRARNADSQQQTAARLPVGNLIANRG